MIAALLPLLVWDLSVSDQGFVSGGDTGQWAWGVAASGPMDPTPVWGTNLAGQYLNDATDTLEIPLPPLGTFTRPVIVLQHWYSLAPGDVAAIQVDDGGGFIDVDPIYGYPAAGGFEGVSGGYVHSSVDLSPFSATPRLQLAIRANTTGADDGWYLAHVALYDGDATPPRITPALAPTDTQDLTGPYPVQLDVVDDVGVASVTLAWSVDGGPEQRAPCVDLGGGLYEGAIDAAAPDSVITWYAEAEDAEWTARTPASGDASFRVYLAAPTELTGPSSSRLVASSALLSWTAPVSPHAVRAYHVVEEGREAEAVEVTRTSALMPLVPEGSQVFAVTAEYDAGQGDPSEPLLLDAEVPELLELLPASAFQGDEVWVELQGASLYLLDGVSTVRLGAGVDVLETTVHDVGSATLRVAVGADAEVGPRALEVVGTQGTFVFEDAFDVRSGADGPRITSLLPSGLLQGQQVDFEARASEPFAGPVRVDVGEDLTVVGEVGTDGATARFTLAARGGSRLGPHTVVLDDGARLWTVDVDVDEFVYQAQRNCSTGAPAGWLGTVLSLAALRRRRGPPGAPAGPCATDP